jgi:hypothetical protein
MARIRTNNVFGTTTNNPLLVGGTTLNSAGLANLGVVAGSDTAIITLDPNRVSGAPEIVIVTAHTAAATSATITRGAEGTAAREHPLGTFWAHAPTVVDWGSDWASWTPAVTQSGSVTVTVTRARYTQIHKTVVAIGQLAVTGTGTAGNAITVTVPVTAAAAGPVAGSAWIFDSSATASYSNAVFLNATTTIRFLNDATGAGAGVGATPSFGLASPDEIRFIVTYEAA